MGNLLPVVVGFLLGLIPGIVRHGFVMVGHCRAIDDIIEEIRSDAEAYLENPYDSPLYRTAANYFNQSFEALMFSGGLRPDEVNVLLRYGNQAEQFNRGLDQVHQISVDDPESARAKAEANRLRLKARQLIPGQSEGTRYDAASETIDRLKQVSWYGWILRQIGFNK